MILTRTPLRISLIGGGTDMPSFYKKNVGGVVSFAIDKYVYVAVNQKFDDKIRVSYSKTENVETLDELHHDLARECLRAFKIHSGIEIASIADIPGEGSGLGSSSAFCVGLINALGIGQHASVLAERAFHVESDACHHPVGKQDQYASAYGGMNYMRFFHRSVEVNPLYPSADMHDNLLLLYTGVTRSANDILKEQSRRFDKGDTRQIGLDLSVLAHDFNRDFKSGMSYERMGEYVQTGWELKKRLSNVTNNQVDGWISAGLANGAFGGKLLGAGQGGFLLFVAPYETHGRIMKATGLRRIDFKIEMEGSKVIYNEN